MEHRDVVPAGRSNFGLMTFLAIGLFGCWQAPNPTDPAARRLAAPALPSGDVTQPSCACQGTGPGSVPVTAACGESACGSDYVLYACDAAGWSWTGQSCGSGAGGTDGGETSCQCDGTGPGNVPVSVACGNTACGSDSYSYACSVAGWSWTGQTCGGDTAGSCACHGTGPGDAPVTASCGVSACGSDHVIYACGAGGWSWTGQPCSGTQAPGETCSSAGDCASGTCTDGRCCTQTCSTCQACTGPAGTCENLPLYAKDNDPANACAGTNACDGAGNCRLDNGQACAADVSVCASAICASGVCCDSACSGACKSCRVAGKVGTCSTIDFSSDPKNCGACGVVCPSAYHAHAGCSAGKCIIICNTTLDADCNGDPTDGCEVNLSRDRNNCGTCGHVCPVTETADGRCGFINRGGSRAGCPSCNVGLGYNFYANCDLDPANGCETYVWRDRNNCGACNNVCPSGSSCLTGRCSSP